MSLSHPETEHAQDKNKKIELRSIEEEKVSDEKEKISVCLTLSILLKMIFFKAFVSLFRDGSID